MANFILFYQGPATPPDASHEGWMSWFSKLGDAVVDQGSPILPNGTVVRVDGSTTESAARLNGYSVIRASSKNDAVELVRDHSYLRLGIEHTIEIFERER